MGLQAEVIRVAQQLRQEPQQVLLRYQAAELRFILGSGKSREGPAADRDVHNYMLQWLAEYEEHGG